MHQGPTSPLKSLFVDYVSPIQPQAIYSAFKARDFLVALTAIGSVLIKLLIVISTGLISLLAVVKEQQNVQILTTDVFTDSTRSLNSVGTLPGYTVLGIQYLKLPYPGGTTNQYAYQSFDVPEIPHGSVIETVVQGFVANLECQTASLIGDLWTYQVFKDPFQPSVVLLNGPDMYQDSCHIRIPDLHLTVGMDGTKQNFTLFGTAGCNNATDKSAQRILLAAGQVLQGSKSRVVDCPQLLQEESVVGDSCRNTNFTLIHSTQLICTPTYSIMPLRVRLNSTDAASVHVVPVTGGSIGSTLTHVHPWDIATAFFGNYNSLIRWTGSGAARSEDSSLVGTSGNEFAIIFDSHPNLTVAQLLDPNTLQSMSTELFQMTTAQIAKVGLLAPASSVTNGTAWVMEDRLVVGLLSVRLMESLFCSLAIIALIAVSLLPREGITSADPGSIMWMASILRGSEQTNNIFRGMGAASLETVRDLTPNMTYWTERSEIDKDKGSFTLHHDAPLDNRRIPRKPVAHSSASWYRPWDTRPWVMATVSLSIAAIITTLEVTLRVSQRNNGLGSVSGTNYLHYLWSFIPASLMSSIALYFSSVDFSAKVVQPYMRLSRYNVHLRQFSGHYLSMMPITACWSAIRHKNILIGLTTSTTMIASVLAIVVSGVFSTQNSRTIVPVRSTIMDFFTTRNEGGTYTGGCENEFGTVAGLVLDSNLTYPKWTYDTLALSSLEMTAQSRIDLGVHQSASLNIRTPAVRAVVNCTLYNSNDITGKNLTGQIGETIMLPIKGCGFFSPYSQIPDGTFGYYWDYTAGVVTTGMLHNCTGFGITWGVVADQQVTRVSAAICAERYERLEVDVVYSLPDFSIDTLVPPIPDEATITFPTGIRFNSSSDLSDAFLPTLSSSGTLDGYFSAIVHGKGGIPESALGDPDMDEAVVETFRHVQSVIRAQQYSLCARTIIPTNATPTVLTGTATNPSELRLVQNLISTRVLEVLLGVLLLGMLSIARLLDTKDIVPKNPCSIAAVASMLADSRLVDNRNDILPVCAEWMSDKELEQHLTGYRFRMGWFGGTHREGGVFKIDVVDEEDENEKSHFVGHTAGNSMF